MNKDRAEIIAINGLSFIAENEKYLSGYLNLSGLNLESLKSGTTNPEIMPTILASVIDYLLQNEKCLIEFSENYEIDPMDISKTRQHFPGAIPYQS